MIKLSSSSAGAEKFRYIWGPVTLGQDVGGSSVDITHNKGKYACNCVARWAQNTTATETNSTSYHPGRATVVWATAFDGYRWQNLNTNQVRFDSRAPYGGGGGGSFSILIDIFF